MVVANLILNISEVLNCNHINFYIWVSFYKLVMGMEKYQLKPASLSLQQNEALLQCPSYTSSLTFEEMFNFDYPCLLLAQQ